MPMACRYEPLLRSAFLTDRQASQRCIEHLIARPAGREGDSVLRSLHPARDGGVPLMKRGPGGSGDFPWLSHARALLELALCAA